MNPMWLLVLCLIPVTYAFHQFWNVQDTMAQQLEIAAFMKNISMMGAALMITCFGAGEFSLDGKQPEGR